MTGRDEDDCRGARGEEGAIQPSGDWVVVSHEDLFAPSDACCDACGEVLGDPSDDEGFAIPGSGAYLWARGDTVRLESVPLCPACASAIGMTALARWEIEEEEG
jgi:hypothetical protein